MERCARRDQAPGWRREGRHPVGAVLYTDPATAPQRLSPIEASIDKTAAALTESVRAAYALHAQRLNTQPVFEPPQTAEEKDAANLIVECASGQPRSRGAAGAGGEGGCGRCAGCGGRCAGCWRRWRRSAAGRSAAGAQAGPSLPQHMNAELSILLGKKLSVLEIRDFLSGEFEPVPLADVMAVLRARETGGAIRTGSAAGRAAAAVVAAGQGRQAESLALVADTPRASRARLAAGGPWRLRSAARLPQAGQRGHGRGDTGVRQTDRPGLSQGGRSVPPDRAGLDGERDDRSDRARRADGHQPRPSSALSASSCCRRATGPRSSCF